MNTQISHPWQTIHNIKQQQQQKHETTTTKQKTTNNNNIHTTHISSNGQGSRPKWQNHVSGFKIKECYHNKTKIKKNNKKKKERKQIKTRNKQNK